MGAGHGHGSAAGRHRWRLGVAFGLVAAFFVVELVVGLAAQSLALISDAGHMAADVVALSQLLAFTEGDSGHRPYLMTGLTEPVATRSGKFAERPIAEATWALVDGLAQLDPNLDAALGGASRASHALWQMALLAHPALPQRTDADRAKLLARLWRSVGRSHRSPPMRRAHPARSRRTTRRRRSCGSCLRPCSSRRSSCSARSR